MRKPGDAWRTIRALFTSTPQRYGWVLDYLAASGRPSSREQVERIYSDGVRAVLTLTEDRLPESYLDGLDITYLHLPLRDHEPPSIEDSLRAAEFIDEMRRRGRKVLVHCAAGLGRTGTIIAAYLVAKMGYGPREAIETVRRLRDGSIEPAQEETVYRVAKWVEENR